MNNHYKFNQDLNMNFNWLQSTMAWAGVSMQKTIILTYLAGLKGERADCGLHPLIHSLLETIVAQDVEKKKSGAEDYALSKFKLRYCG